MIDWAYKYWILLVPITVFITVAVLEYVSPRRSLVLGRYHRWRTHFGIFLLNLLVGRLLVPVVAVAGTAAWAQSHSFGLLYWVSWPWWVETALVFILLDFAVWAQHVLMHKIPSLWRAHSVHHSDRDLDATTALRFHPFELIVSTLYKSIWVAMLGVPVVAALAFEIWLNANALFNHANLALPKWLDRRLRWFLVTPDMHLVHHSSIVGEQHHNFGFALTIWDRIFGLYQAESVDGRGGQIIGLVEAQDRHPRLFLWSMLLPLRGVS